MSTPERDRTKRSKSTKRRNPSNPQKRANTNPNPDAKTRSGNGKKKRREEGEGNKEGEHTTPRKEKKKREENEEGVEQITPRKEKKKREENEEVEHTTPRKEKKREENQEGHEGSKKEKKRRDENDEDAPKKEKKRRDENEEGHEGSKKEKKKRDENEEGHDHPKKEKKRRDENDEDAPKKEKKKRRDENEEGIEHTKKEKKRKENEEGTEHSTPRKKKKEENDEGKRRLHTKKSAREGRERRSSKRSAREGKEGRDRTRNKKKRSRKAGDKEKVMKNIARNKFMDSLKQSGTVQRRKKMGRVDLRNLVWMKLDEEGKIETNSGTEEVETFTSTVSFNSALEAKAQEESKKQQLKENIRERVKQFSLDLKNRRALRDTKKKKEPEPLVIDEPLEESSSESLLDVGDFGELFNTDTSSSSEYDDMTSDETSSDRKSDEMETTDEESVDYHPILFGAEGIILTELDKVGPTTGSLNFRLKSNTAPPVASLFDVVKGRRNSISSNQGLRHPTTPALSNLVLDCGSTMIKCGVAGEDVPRHLIPSLLAKYREDSDIFVGGLDALNLIRSKEPIELDDFEQPVSYSQFTYSNPLDPNGIDWDDTTLMWESLFSDVYQVDPEDHNVMMIETPDMSWTGRAETMEIMFEVFNVPKLKISNSGLMSLYGCGELNGLVVDLGRRLQIIPVVDGMVEQYHAYNLTRGISESEEHFSRLLRYAGYSLDINNNRDYQILKELKERCCYVAQDYEAELERPRAEIVKDYVASNGQTYSLGEERFQCAEPLFNPILQGHLEKEQRLQTLVFNSIKKCPIDSRRSLFSNIMLVGGGSCYDGLPQRLQTEVQKLSDHKIKTSVPVKVIAEHNRKYLSWMGASLFAGFSNFEDFTIWKDDYEERGAETIAQETMYT